jgi:hypothetical protein
MNIIIIIIIIIILPGLIFYSQSHAVISIYIYIKNVFIYLFIYFCDENLAFSLLQKSPKQHDQGNFLGNFSSKNILTFLRKKVMKLFKIWRILGKFRIFLFSIHYILANGF